MVSLLPFVVGKWVYLLLTVIRFSLRGLAVTALAALSVVALQVLTGQFIASETALQQVLANPLYELLIWLLALAHVRMIVFRLSDRTRTG